MKPLLFVCFLSFVALPVLAFPTLQDGVPSQCADPTFACQDLQTARICNTVKSCIHDIWAYMSAPTDNDEICDICKEMVKEARDQLLSNMTQEEIKEVFEGSCKLLPVKIIAEGCIKVVDEIIPELVEMLASRMDPNMVCTVSGMCFPSKSNNAIENNIRRTMNMLLTKDKDVKCDECITMATDAQTFMKSESESEIKTILTNACKAKLPSYLCKIVLNKYFHEIYTYILSTTPAELCSSAGVCPQTSESRTEESKVKDDLTCEFCEHLLEHVKDLITTNTTMDEFKNALLNFCKVTGKFSDKCTALVNDYYDKLFTYIKNLDSKGMCTLMGLCTSGKSSLTPLVKLVPSLEARRKIPLIKIQMAQDIETNEISYLPLVHVSPAKALSKKMLKESNDIKLKMKALQMADGPFCDLCKDAMNEVEKQLSDPATKQKLEDLLGQVCKVLPKSLQDDCVSFINQNVDAVLDILEQELKPDNICPALRLCSTPRLGISPRVNDLKCDVCKDMVSSFRQKLQDPASKQMVETFLEEGCAKLPGSIATECKKFVDDNIDYLMKIIVEEMDPDKVCAILSICPASLPRISLVKQSLVNDIECDLCKEVVGKVEDLVKDQKTEDEIKAALDKVCSYLPSSLAPKCQNFVNQYADLVITLLMQELDPAMVCAELKLCPASVSKVEEVPLEAFNLKDVECELCKEVVGKLEDIIKDEKTEDEIKAALDKVCSYLPSSMTTKCQNFINQYTDLLITILMQEADPQMVCAALKLCTESERRVEAFPLEGFNLKDVECELCKEVVGKLEDLLKDKSTVDEIKAALDKVCSYLPSSLAPKCQNFVNQYTDLLITLLEQEVDPQMICSAMKLCTDSLRSVEPAPMEAFKLKDLECDLCKQVVGKLEDLLKAQSTQDEIKAALDKVCSLLPSSIATKCENFVNQYVSLLITILSEEMNPDMVCAALSVCPEKANFAEWQAKAKDLECKGCQYALNYLQQELLNAQTQEKVKLVLKKACTLLPGTYSNNCDAFVDEYGTSLLVLLAHEINPSQLCYKAQMCTNETNIFMKTEPEMSAASLHLDECSICTTIVDYLDRLLEQDDVDKEITHLVKRVCTVLPASFQDKCSSVLEAYGPYILQMIGQMADSKQICQSIDMCARSPELVHLIGGSKCTFGPSYWCRSQTHAAACKAESFCKDKVWKN